MSVHLRLATDGGFREITPATLTRCGFENGCCYANYIDGPADGDPYYHCEVYDRRTDGKRLPECVRAANPVIIEELRQCAEHLDYERTVVVPFPNTDPPLPLPKKLSAPRIWQTLRFDRKPYWCDTHGEFWAALLPGENSHCPYCMSLWQQVVCRVLYQICEVAVVQLHRMRMAAEAARDAPRWAILTPNEAWYLLGLNPSWNPSTEVCE